ncbi:type IV pilus assembly protein PilC [Geothermobacter ehrlichii]|uniref:Type IV pilus assembly protein PilC n=1 Tax=Geothermobacter ehrlichii TaxID=213224 RepID=A0A5D3WK52_9BACT|nr:type II secretion system F family protein [Geothermobacter ehrlichii]TYO98734.1 type IV pilus assembly protein PilC [Geothermobacter ehrlichii]
MVSLLTMPTFICKIGTSDGRVVEREFEAVNSAMLREQLEEQGFYVFQIRRAFLAGLTRGGGRRRGWSSRRFLSFNQEFLVLLKAGLPIIQIFDTLLERQEGGMMQEVLRAIREDVKAGTSLSDALGKFPRFFPHLYVASVRAGERTGDLPITLVRYIEYQKRIEAIKARVRNATFYPMLLTGFVVLVVLFLMLYVVPSFSQIYADAKVELPLMTRILIAVANGMVGALPLLVGGLVLLVVSLRSLLMTERGVFFFDRLKLRIPFFGALLTEYALLSFCRTLATILLSGVPIVKALQMSRGTLNNRVLETAVVQAIRRVEEGMSLSESFDRCGFFPNIALRMVAVGEKGGSLPEMLADVADYYESEVERRLDRLTTMIEPVMMASMGLLIGGIVVAMYFPIFQLAGTVG